jgi:hypothetical protein
MTIAKVAYVSIDKGNDIGLLTTPLSIDSGNSVAEPWQH